MIVLLEEIVPGCSGLALLPCVVNGARNILFQVFESNGDRFLTLTSARIRENPDYDDSYVNGIYTLQVIHIEKHNGSRFRCSGLFNGAVVYSNVVQLLPAGEFVWSFVVV